MSAIAPKAVRQNRSQVSFHYGKALLKLANTYPTLFEVVLESVQNAIDSGATRVDVKINQKDRSVSIMDNGNGVDRKGLEGALGRVCDSVKTKDKLGRYGLGLIASLGKCELMTFTSCASVGNEGYQEWMFDTDRIAAQAQSVQVPVITRPYFYRPNGAGPVPKGLHPAPWRTRVHIKNYVTDRKISEIRSAEALKEAIIEKYGVTMRRNNVSVSVEIIREDGAKENASGKAKLFAGKKLPEVIIDEKDAGRTIIRLYLARKSTFGYKGKVLVGNVDNDFRFSFDLFTKDAADFLSDGVIELFKSKMFEGEILTTNAKLHDSRRKFEQNDAFVGFCAAIEDWFLEHGKKHLKEVKDERQGQRMQDLALRSLQNVKSMLSDPAFDRLREETIDSFKHGTVGAGHLDPDDRKIVRTQESSSMSVTAASRKQGGGSGEGHPNDPPEREHTGHTPFTAAGPSGQQRKEVKGGSRGLQFDHAALRADGPLAVLEPSNGTIWFNLEHPEWVAASQAGDRELMQLQEVGAIMALVRHTMPEEYQSYVDLIYGDVLSPLSFLLRNSPSFNLKARIKANKANQE